MKLMNFLSIQFSYLLKFRIILYLIYFVAFLAYAGTKFHTIFIFLVNFYNHVKILWFTSWQKSEKLYLDTKTPFLRPGHTLVQSKLKSLSLTLEINSSSARKSSTYDTGITPRMLQNCHLLINCDIIGILQANTHLTKRPNFFGSAINKLGSKSFHFHASIRPPKLPRRKLLEYFRTILFRKQKTTRKRKGKKKGK